MQEDDMEKDDTGILAPRPAERLTMPTPTTPRHHVTAEDLKLFMWNPFQLVDRQFILHPDEHERDGGSILCEIIGARTSQTEDPWYIVQFGRSGSVEMCAQEMMEVLKDSILLGPTGN
jgi:hypothetical protein